MSSPAIDRTLWQGRIDPEPGSDRWHQKVQPFNCDKENGTVLLGFCCDEGVRRNHGRVGARDAPDAIRRALASLAWHGTRALYDAGNVACDDGDLERAQRALAAQVATVLRERHLPVVLGGGHEVAFASWLGLRMGLAGDSAKIDATKTDATKIGIINFDAHFDLRTPQDSDTPEDARFERILGQTQIMGSSGTPFAQISRAERDGFHYAVLGISRPNNTAALFARAKELNVWVVEDTDIHAHSLPAIRAQLADWLHDKTHVYLSFDIDVLPASQAPGCSAPAALGVELGLLLPLIAQIRQSGKLVLADIAEVNPKFDIDQRTARVAARIVHCLHGG